jgi:squalene monooxygenase
MGHADVIIAGAGFAGLSAAAAFAASGAQVTVLEALENPLPAFRGELLHPPGVRALERHGLTRALACVEAVPVRGFAVFSPFDRQAALLAYESTPAPGAAFGHQALIQSLRNELSTNARVRIVLGARVEALTVERGRAAGVRCAGGAEYACSLVVAADGRHSRLRKLLGIPTRTRLLSYMALLGLDCAVLPEPGFGNVFVGAPGPILAYAYGARRARLCIDVPLGAARGGGKALLGYVRDRYTEHLPEPFRTALRAELDCGRLAACANHVVTTTACVAPGAALVGDAGGCSHPLTATGMTTALHDVTTLVDCVIARGLTDDALTAYQERRFNYVRARELFAQALYDVFRGNDLASCTLRGGLFRYWQHPARASASIAILSGEEPRLSAFLAEYARVAGASCWQTARTVVARPNHSIRSLAALAAATAAGARGVFRQARATRLLGRSAELAPLPP